MEYDHVSRSPHDLHALVPRLPLMNFADELIRHGPGTSTVDLSTAQDYCAKLTASHYENFHVVSWLTPRRLRPAFQAIYAFCRWSDDLGDEVGNPEESRRLLRWWRGELSNLYRGEVRHPIFVALRPVIAHYGIPIMPFEALISAFEQDQEIKEYGSFEQLLDYCSRSANPVGHLVLYLAHAFNKPNALLADQTCSALQLTNFWQDVGRDLAIGRIYLPRQDRERFGVTEAHLGASRASDSFRRLLAFEVDRTRAMFRRGWPLVTRLPRAIAVDVDLFTRGGLAILDRIAAEDFDVLSTRPTLTKAAKFRLLAHALIGTWRHKTPAYTKENVPAIESPLAEVRSAP